ncbi:MAG TPA: DUF2281 domain-containing protein [Gemmataceae bacterium]|jgi:antitoxin (DNA-binding transcriptional repressor) of toxin-antitoxin stability system|nr:DUF2281 domain-containing protein [Gemmataceae bacterium]
MAAIVSVDEAQVTLKELIRNLTPGEEIVITDNQQPVAKLIGAAKPVERKLGTLQGTVLYMAPDFDVPLDDFKEYME